VTGKNVFAIPLTSLALIPNLSQGASNILKPFMQSTTLSETVKHVHTAGLLYLLCTVKSRVATVYQLAALQDREQTAARQQFPRHMRPFCLSVVRRSSHGQHYCRS